MTMGIYSDGDGDRGIGEVQFEKKKTNKKGKRVMTDRWGMIIIINEVTNSNICIISYIKMRFLI